MIELFAGFIITITSLLLGYNLGKYQSVTPPEFKKKLDAVFNRVVPNNEVGAISRPTQRQNDLRDNPKLAQEEQIMESAFDDLLGE